MANERWCDSFILRAELALNQRLRFSRFSKDTRVRMTRLELSERDRTSFTRKRSFKTIFGFHLITLCFLYRLHMWAVIIFRQWTFRWHGLISFVPCSKTCNLFHPRIHTERTIITSERVHIFFITQSPWGSLEPICCLLTKTIVLVGFQRLSTLVRLLMTTKREL